MTENLATSCKNTTDCYETLIGEKGRPSRSLWHHHDIQLSIFSFPAWDMIITSGNYPNYISPSVSSSSSRRLLISKYWDSPSVNLKKIIILYMKIEQVQTQGFRDMRVIRECYEKRMRYICIGVCSHTTKKTHWDNVLCLISLQSSLKSEQSILRILIS